MFGDQNFHATEVQSFLNEKSKLLGRIPPIIAANENKFERKTRCTLAQFRPGDSTHFNSYYHRLNYNIPNVCPSCYIGPHTTEHLFKCRVHPTALTIDSLWENSEEAANHL